ncbi:RICIN domain-containing protein [Streptomyces sp. NPDC002596]|nr:MULTISPECIES: RICIN domain-containing protein [unclassified Streptomyces]MCX4538870.1 RICIN domain-containing protein [Streptomyces sp. NBC_01669]WSA05339.1 RICIN domain-containing protein [Streptomyces sp. NBC_00841]
MAGAPPDDARDAEAAQMQAANGTRLQLWSCAGSPNQKWSTD